MKLYDIEQELQEVEAMLDEWASEHEGDFTDFPLMKELDEIEQARENKLLNIGCWVKSLDAEVEAYKQEKQKIDTKKKVVENKANRLREYLSSYLKKDEKIKDPRCQLAWRKSKSLNITVETEALPDEFIKTEKTVKKAELKNAIKAGLELEGVTIKTNDNLQIK
jgi:hypothetical protein